MIKKVYLDNNATTMVDPAVAEAIATYFQQSYGNPSSMHVLGQIAYQHIQAIRADIAQKLGCSPHEIIFTSSGTEANNLCIKGFAYANRTKGNHIITSKIEHPSVLNTCAYLEKQGFELTYLDVNREGFIDANDLRQHIRKETILISIGHVNSEIGTIQPLAVLIQAAAGIPFHTDVVQSFLKTDFNIQNYPVALASFSGHKFHGPKGIGFIYKKEDVAIEPQIHGGQQERELRSGTENTAGIVGMGIAVQHYDPKNNEKMRILQRELMDELVSRFQVRINGPKNQESRVCNNINVSFDSIEGDILIQHLSQANIYVSTGSACHSKQARVSHVLKAIQCPPHFIHGNIRIGLSKYTTRDEINHLLQTVSEILSHHNPFSLCTR